ncbi:octanoyltransferase [Tersicoccus solisilvae]|uniref:Octanoyltransferase n=1 Tax=Tersicoccus solisilvae TaxID=1882339 RepID=A0ABQ1PC15_9MICC|nr:lipoyl(octanoyl) transferase LipB [Tersicoccus solisilvae]GGC94275.1 octanoyltransferase [Tersicoccus solisilvae]
MTLRFPSARLAPDFVDYREAWAEQQRLHRAVAAGDQPNTVLLLEHPPVYTAGKRTEPQDYPYDGTDVVTVDRGGRLTWHGPGQLIGYPILRLPRPLDVVAYVRALETILIATLREVGVEGVTVEGRSGVWLPGDSRGPDRKIAAIGIRVADGVTMHGVAINASCDLRPFGKIVPCGIADASVTSVREETGREVTPADLAPIFQAQLLAHEALLTGPGATSASASAPEGALL